MRILVTNDDGVHSPGLWAVAEALKSQGEVTVVAPDRDQSGIGAAMTLLSVIRAREIASPVDGIKTFSVEGTPADCVILAMEGLAVGPFDLVVSGINQGANLGLDVLASGTLGGAFQGHFRGLPSIAVSVAALTNVKFEAATRVTVALAGIVKKNPTTKPLLLNVNLPNIGPEEIEGVEVTKLGARAFMETVERVNEGRRSHFWIRYNWPADAHEMEGGDFAAIRNKNVSITPLGLSFQPPDTLSSYGGLATGVASDLGL